MIVEPTMGGMTYPMFHKIDLQQDMEAYQAKSTWQRIIWLDYDILF